MANEIPYSAPVLAALHFTFDAFRHLITLRRAHLPDGTVQLKARLTFQSWAFLRGVATGE